MHRTQDTFPLTHFRQHTGEHLERLTKGVIEIITQNGEAAMIVMSPARYDAMVHEIERGHLWDKAIARYKAGERGISGDEMVDLLKAELEPAL